MSRRRGRVSGDLNGGSIPFSRAPKEPVPLDEVAVLLHPDDDVAIAKAQLAPGTVLLAHRGRHGACRAGDPLRAQGCASSDPGGRARPPLRPGHRRDATQAVGPGEHVHSHNLAVGEVGHDYAFCEDVASRSSSCRSAACARSSAFAARTAASARATTSPCSPRSTARRRRRSRSSTSSSARACSPTTRTSTA